MTPEIRRFAELVAYILLTAMLLASALLAIHMKGANDILIGGIMTALAIPLQAVARIGQSEAMTKMADHLARSAPQGRTQPVEVVNKPSDPIPVEQANG